MHACKQTSTQTNRTEQIINHKQASKTKQTEYEIDLFLVVLELVVVIVVVHFT